MAGIEYTLEDIAGITESQSWRAPKVGHREIREIAFDSRQIQHPASALFIAISGANRDGHEFIHDAYEKGVRNFLVEKTGMIPEDAGYIQAASALGALHKWAAFHRRKFQYPLAAIAGSNGKTIVKEWIATLLENKMQVVKSPKSFNSKIGVPLSLLQMDEGKDLALIEAGISSQGEMEILHNMIRPDYGIFTHFGDAHAEGFSSPQEKLREKLSLFSHCKKVFLGADDLLVMSEARSMALPLVTIGKDPEADYRVSKILKEDSGWELKLEKGEKEWRFSIPVPGEAALENGLLAWLTAVELGLSPEEASEGMQYLHPVTMRTELITDNPEITILNDAYNADLSSIGNAFSLLESNHSRQSRMVVLSDLEHQGRMQEEGQRKILRQALEKFGAGNVLLVGPVFSRIGTEFPGVRTWNNLDELLRDFDYDYFRGSTVLLKGARKFHLEKLIPFLSRRVNATSLKINLNDLAGNFRFFRQQTGPGVKIMAMVKAFSYGSGSWEIAQALEKEGADYFAVAYLSEGIELRARGIRKPIMVMNPDTSGIAQLFHFSLEPEVFSLNFLERLAESGRLMAQREIRLHLKVDSGMHRLGFSKQELPALAEFLSSHPELKIVSVFSHLSAAEDPGMDELSHAQATYLHEFWKTICEVTGTRPMRHLLNSPGILRFPEYHFEMVRPGIGLYGVNPLGQKTKGLNEIGSLLSFISQIREYPPGTGIGYGHSQVTTTTTRIATIPVGYADGIPRSLGNGKISFLIHEKPAPVFGRICMDMLMVDVTGIPEAKEGDEVVLFGEQGKAFQSVEVLAKAAGTIAYEILAGISQRVRRVFVRE